LEHTVLSVREATQFDIMPRRQRKIVSRLDGSSLTSSVSEKKLSAWPNDLFKKKLVALPLELFEKIVGGIAFIYLPHFIQCSKGIKVRKTLFLS